MKTFDYEPGSVLDMWGKGTFFGHVYENIFSKLRTLDWVR